MDKMIKTAKNLHTMAITAKWICLITAILMPVAALIVRLLPKQTFDGAHYSLDVGNFDLDLALDGLAPGEVTRQDLILGLLFVGLVLLLVWMCLRVIVTMLAPMAQGRPFTENVSASLQSLSLVALIGGFVYEFGKVVLSMIQYSNYNLPMIFDSEAIAGYSVEFEINYTFLLLFLLLRLMSYVFRYGQQLQQLEEETL